MMRSLLNMFTGRPVLCVYDLTTRCNSKCSMCSIWKRKEPEMEIGEIRKVFSDLKRFGIHTVFLQGGEPLLRSDFFEIAQMLDGMGFTQAVLTNGILSDGKFLSRLSGINRKGRISVTVSLDTLDRAKYRKIRGVDKLETVLGNIRALSEHRNLRGNLHATVTSINHGELPALLEFSKKLGLGFSFNSYNDSINYASSKDSELSLGKGPEHVIASMEKALSGMPRIHHPFIRCNMRYMRGEDVGACDAFRNSLRLTPDGRLSPCLELPPVLDLTKADINAQWPKISRMMSRRIKACYTHTPCFYGCTRGIGCVKRSPVASALGAMGSIAGKR